MVPDQRHAWGNPAGITASLGRTCRPDSDRSDQYGEDGRILGQLLQADYLARDNYQSGDNKKAVEYFVKRAELSYWADENFVILYRAAQLQEAMGQPFDEVLAAYLRAADASSSRAEALYAASRLCRLNTRFADGYEFASLGLKIPLPADGLFVQTWVYDYALLDEFAICAYWIGRYQESFEACQRLLGEDRLPQSKYDRVRGNSAAASSNMASGDSRAALVARTPDTDGGSGCSSRLVNHETRHDAVKVLLVCGPWGSGTSTVAGLLDRLGALGLGPYIQTNDPRTPNSYESISFTDVVHPCINLPTLSVRPCAPDAVQSALRGLRRRIEQQEFGPYDHGSPKPVFLKTPASALLIPQICEVFDTKLIYVMRPLEDIERTRLRRLWLPYHGAAGAKAIYDNMADVQQRHSYPTFTIDYNELLAAPAVHVRDIARFAGFNPGPAEFERAVGFVGAGRS
jgi:tetratricopeptide (TPR) repeat protein